MDHTIIEEAATKIVANIKAMGDDIAVLQNKQDIISTSDTTMTGSYPGRLSIEEIGGKCEQFSTTGKNLLNCSRLTTITTNGVTFTPFYDNDGNLLYVEARGTATSERANYDLSAILDVPTDSFILNGCSDGSYTTHTLYVSYFDDSGVWQSETHQFNNTDVSIKNTYPKYQIGILIRGNVTVNARFYPMLRLASVADPTYEPYTGGQPSPNPDYPQEIKKTIVGEIKTHGLNCLDMRNAKSGTNGGITATMNPDGSYSYVGTATNTEINIWLMGNWTGTPTLFTLPAGKYFMQGVNLYNDGKPVFVGGREGSTIVLNEDTPVTGVRAVGAVAGTTYNETHYPIIARSDGRVYQWQPYTESTITLSQPVELYGIGDVQDTIEDGKVVRRCGIKVFNGTEDLNTQQDATYFLAPCDNLKLNTESWYLAGALCNRLIEKTPDSLWGNPDDGFTINTTDWYPIRFRIGVDVTSIDLAKAKLKEWYDAGNPMTVFHKLATPVTEDLPLVDQMALSSLKTYDGITYLEFDSEIEPTFQAEYGVTKIGGYALEGVLAGVNGTILGQSNTNRITALEATLVNNI